MPEDSFIDRDFRPPGAQNFADLRELGLRRIQQLSGDIWTNHNSPDPGITIMEALAYAITDLGYRTSFPMRDLLTRPDGRIGPATETGLYPAHEALTTAPVTIDDHRRLLLRIEGVRNAWLDPMTDPAEPANYRISETSIYADCLADALSHEALNAAGESNHDVRISGLYRVMVELEVDERLGSLNETALEVTFRAGPLKGVIVAIDYGAPPALPAYAEPAAPDPLAPENVTVENLSGAGNGVEFTADLIVEQNSVEIARLEGLTITVIEDRPRPGAAPVTVTEGALGAALAEAGAEGPAGLFLQKREARRRAMNAVHQVLHAHRPLSEDYLSIDTIAPQRIGVCGDVDLAPDADLEAVEAAILHAIETYLSPPPVFETLDALLAAGVPADEIFNGPYVDFGFTVEGREVFTKPGFITEENLRACALRRKVHASDLINIIVDLDGVVGVRNLTLRAYDAQGLAIGATEKWTLDIPPGRQPVHYFPGTKLLLFKNELPYRAQPTEAARTLAHLRALARTRLYVPPNQILPALIGEWRGLDEFQSLQDDLPRIYGTDSAGLPPEAPKERVAEVRQLKAYLTFFDQALADYLGQLGAARRILSPDKTLERTWFSPYLDGIAGTRGDFPTEFYTNPAALSDDITRVRLNETEEAFLDRRARALNHLIARFAERFADYALLSFQLSGDRLKTARELIDDRADFLADYPKASRERGKGFNQLPEDPAQIWDSDNISGLERRASRLLGIGDPTRRDLHCGALFDALFAARADGGQFRAVVRGEGATRLLTSEELFPTAAAALDAARALEFRLNLAETYQIDASAGVGAVRLALAGGGVTLTARRLYETEAEAVAAARAILDRHNALLTSPLCNVEGMHLIEHILLRPRAPGDALMQVCLDEECEFCGDEDPYSFRVSIILPYWPSRFQNLDFRRFAERLIREETPAHIHPRICWIDNGQMAALDAAHRAWREALAAKPHDADALRDAAAALIDVLNSLRTVYPPAVLHDCDEAGEDDNVVRLGATNLGLF
ncbi:hypothetical protein G5B40_11595 [Pikeienuella piscinae]|uniref:Uncharacterized protein n=1 Tax=Pikeienuella piscinae TaxID=2748098 RepID=A0A7L5C2E3_9RHOB|nr:hypothetical protein [Pikeienuella piscinae]QIE56039.1 hypothetical protein G5B40_11595 [Pikeienuella piscinae]